MWRKENDEVLVSKEVRKVELVVMFRGPYWGYRSATEMTLVCSFVRIMKS